MLTSSGDRKFVLDDSKIIDEEEEDKSEDNNKIFVKPSEENPWFSNKIQLWKLSEPALLEPIPAESVAKEGQEMSSVKESQEIPSQESDQVVGEQPDSGMNLEQNQAKE
jgi:hypothetical protein